MSPVGETDKCLGLSRPDAITFTSSTDAAPAGAAPMSPAAATAPSTVMIRTIPTLLA